MPDDFVKTANDSIYQILAVYSTTVEISRGKEWSGTVNKMVIIYLHI